MSISIETNKLNYANSVYKPIDTTQQQTANTSFKGTANKQTKEMSSNNKLLLTLGGLALAGIGIYLACRGKTSAAQNTLRTASNAGSKTAANAANTASGAGAKAAGPKEPLAQVFEEITEQAKKEANKVIESAANDASKATTPSTSALLPAVKAPTPQIQPIVPTSVPTVPARSVTPATVQTPQLTVVPPKPVQSAATKIKPPQTSNQSTAEIETRANQLWESKQKEIEEAFSKKRKFSASHTDCTMIETSAKEHLLGSIEQVTNIKDFGMAQRNNLYHGTSSEAAASIKADGFDLRRCKRGEVGRGVYFGYDKDEILKKYGDGSSIVTAVFTGNNVAHVKPGVYYAVEGNSLFQMELARKLGLNWSNPQEEKILKNIISKYYNSLLESHQIQGIVVKGSINAGLPYFMVPNTKYIQIIK